MNFARGMVAECIVDKPVEHSVVRLGARGVIYAVDNNRVSAYWMNPSGEVHNGWLDVKNIRILMVLPGNDFVEFLGILGKSLIELGYRPTNTPPEKLKELGESWTGTDQILKEMAAWLDVCDKAKAAFAALKVPLPVPKKEEAKV